MALGIACPGSDQHRVPIKRVGASHGNLHHGAAERFGDDLLKF